ncbi:hypothetical protein K491DRAFT_677238 [Lophiostoma macrostomum CBS 122681]|uniref:Tat pathway signal sequence n=1 Tax=Lophiostoma macrostomum CBS 122681 TaxID=1314788 RepID=A0A6A6TFM0_9PLEO|nr:hypothetical protein K491DRAFT_677238 [Lophiostoma macrostomum CBS 122681]
MESKNITYHPVSSSEDVSYSSTQDEERSSEVFLLNPHQKERRRSMWISTSLLASSVFLNLLISVVLFFAITKKPTDQQCSRQLSVYLVEYIEYDFAAEFNSTNIYRGPPTPEREEAWYNLTYKHAIEIPATELASLNRSEADHLRHASEDESSGYVALIEVFHQLHCLNMIRRYTWYQAGKYADLPNGLVHNEVENRMHIDHCIDALRIAIQCFGDVTPLFIKLGGHAGSKADFNSHHKCRNFDKIESWIDENWTID